MPRESEQVRFIKLKISTLENNIKKLNEQIFKQQAEKKAYEGMLEWHLNTKGRKNNDSKNKNA
jgi:hypothetical protein